MVFGFFVSKWNPDGKHVYVTGGSSGLGLALAKILVQKGAHVSIVARRQSLLDSALADLETHRVSPGQILQARSFGLSNAKSSREALDAVCEAHGGDAPDAVVTCAGSSKPKFVMEMTDEDLVEGMDAAYWVQAWTAIASAKKMVKQGKKGRIVLVASFVSYISFVGWASYAPGKYALRGLSDTLSSEFLLYDIDVHTFYPTTILSPGFEEENKTKPAITLEIEGTDGCTPEETAQALLKGIQSGRHRSAADFLTRLVGTPSHVIEINKNWLLDFLLYWLAFILLPILHWRVRRMLLAHRQDHQKYLRANGVI